MITDFNEIPNEKDRELYVELRNILDNYFMSKIRMHKEKDHEFHECEIFDIPKELEKMLPKQLKEECKSGISEIEVIEDWIHYNEGLMITHMEALIILNHAYDKRKQ